MHGWGLINPGHACSLIRESIMRFLRRGPALVDITSHIVYLLDHLLTLRRIMPQDPVRPWDVAEAAQTMRALLPTVLQAAKKDAFQDIREALL
jgi:hypothetical protein